MSPFAEDPDRRQPSGFFFGDKDRKVVIETEHIHIASQRPLPSPREVRRLHPATDAVLAFVADSRRRVEDIITCRDHRLLAVVGPCSIHDPDAALDYADRLRALAWETRHSLYIVMRAYLEKPRTTSGWKGLINDPYLNGTYHIEEGIRVARKLLLDITASGVPVATEALDPMTPRYLQDLVIWSAIGARSAESQIHREMASGLSSVVGVKNGTDGSFAAAINALKSIGSAHRHLGIDSDGRVAAIHTHGNNNAHIVLRGGHNGPNYDARAISRCEDSLARADLPANIMVDCSHANSNKDHERQQLVVDAVAQQIAAGNRSIVGIMIESNIRAGNQPLAAAGDLAYGVSITDACLGWNDTEAVLRHLASRLRDPLVERPARFAKAS